ncbi:hypothetical protein DIPPA_27994 [Diplonema papillatum]|nr:hypothetical protein DIPPA_27994 [Diplonema papillatum]
MSSGFTEAASGFTEEVAPQEEEQPEQQETLETLVRTMELYEEHLQQAEALLETDPTSEEVLKIKQEVVDAMEITQNKITEKRKQATLARIDSLVAGAVAEALLDGVWYTVYIQQVLQNEQGHRLWKVLSVGYSIQFDVPADRLRPWEPPLNIKQGDKIEAVHPLTKQFNDATIDTITDQGTVWVLFKGDKNIEEVQLTHVRTQKATLPVKRPRKDMASTEPTELDEQALAKEKKRRKRQKWQERQKVLNEEQETSRTGWSSFVQNQKERSCNPPGIGSLNTANATRARVREICCANSLAYFCSMCPCR